MADQSTITLDEFKARLPLADIVARQVRLTRRGRDLWGCCPFHHEKTPSFHVVPDKGFYHCFGCGQHGNAIDFVMAVEGLDFGQAVQRLAELTGLPAPGRGADAAPRVDQTLYDANAAAARWFAGRLESAQGTRAAAYLAGRGLDTDTIRRFGLGYAPDDRGALKRALRAEGYADETLLEAGLLSRPEDGESYDHFRNRVMFPIHDRRGRVVGFGGRALGEARAKYLNTSDTPLFHKGALLYGLTLARQAVRERGTVIVAEGYMDVIALARAGFANAVAPLGTAVTEAQLALLWQLADEPVVCLDGDEAGLRAAHRLVERALPVLKPGKSLRFAVLPVGQDPDSLLRSAGREALARQLDEALPLVDFLWRRETAGRSFATPERRAAFSQRCHQLAQAIADGQLRWLFRQELQQRLRAEFATYEPRRRGQPPAPSASIRTAGARRLSASIPQQTNARQLMGPILAHPEMLQDVEEELGSVTFSDPELEAMRQAVLTWYAEGGTPEPTLLREHLLAAGHTELIESFFLGESEATTWYRKGSDPASVLENWRLCLTLHRRSDMRPSAREAYAEAILAGGKEGSVFRREADRLMNDAPATKVARRSDEA